MTAETPHRIDRAVREALSGPWFIHAPKFELIVEVLSRRVQGILLTPDEISAAVGTAGSTVRPTLIPSARGGSVAVIPIHGIIAHRSAMVNNVSTPGGTSIEWLRQTFRSAMKNPAVSAVVLDVDSPGGTVALVDEMAREIRQTSTKPVVAHINDFAASSGYYLASAADEIVITPSGQAGSIGVYASHEDISALAAKRGVKTTLISAGEGKTDGNAFEPLSDDARADMQDKVDGFYRMFVDAVVAGRQAAGQRLVTPRTVRTEWKASMFSWRREAARLGLVDSVGTSGDAIRAAERLATRSRARVVAQDRQRLMLMRARLGAPPPGHKTRQQSSVERTRSERRESRRCTRDDGSRAGRRLPGSTSRHRGEAIGDARGQAD